jgi:hypothetical protein
MNVSGLGHIPQVLWIVVKFLLQLVVTVMGMAVIPLFNHRVKKSLVHSPYNEHVANVYKDGWLDRVFGNNDDGVDGDGPYYEKDLTKWLYSKGNVGRWMARYIWSAWRNPVHNLKQTMGVNESIVEYNYVGRWDTSDRVGYEGAVYSEAIGESGYVYPMYYVNYRYFGTRFGFTANIGYKNFNVDPGKLPWSKPRGYSFTVAINPIKQFEV